MEMEIIMMKCDSYLHVFLLIKTCEKHVFSLKKSENSLFLDKRKLEYNRMSAFMEWLKLIGIIIIILGF